MTKPRFAILVLAAVLALLYFGTIHAYAEVKIVGTISTDGFPSTKYTSLAKISMPDAVGKALEKVNGKVSEAALENEDGFLVYSIEIVTPGNKRSEVLVDAGDGRILAVEDGK